MIDCLFFLYICMYVATRTGVICLQDLCIETIVRSIVSFEDVKSLTLPPSVKDKVSKLVLNPSEDFMRYI